MNKIKSALLSIVILSVVIGLSIYVELSRSDEKAEKLKNQKIVHSMPDGKGIFVGEMRPQYQQPDPSKWSPETRRRVEEYEAQIKAQDQSNA